LTVSSEKKTDRSQEQNWKYRLVHYLLHNYSQNFGSEDVRHLETDSYSYETISDGKNEDIFSNTPSFAL
jgi:hypothetical protein